MNDLKKLIPTGRENAVLLQDLARQADMNSRTIKARIQALRDQGEVILSSSSGGYFYPSRDEEGLREVNHFIDMMNRQAKSRFVRSRSAKRWRDSFNQIGICEVK